MAYSGINPNIVVRDLNHLASTIFEEEERPDIATPQDEMIFHQMPTEYGSVKAEVFAGGGYWGQRNEQQNVPLAQSRTAQKVTTIVNEFAQEENISRWYFDDAEFNAVETIVRKMAFNGRNTQKLQAFELFRGAFGNTLTSDGLSLCNSAHTLIGSGATVNNTLTAKLNDGTLNTMIQVLLEMPGQDGVIQGFAPELLLLPVLRYKIGVELLDSEWAAQTANNAVNVYRSKYGIVPKQTPFIGAGVSAGTNITVGSNDIIFLLGRNHEIYRYIRQPLQTDIVDYKYQGNNNYIYKASYREAYKAVDFLGLVGTQGTTGAYA